MKFLQFSILAILMSMAMVSCGDDTIDDPMDTDDAIIWSGTPLSFVKADGADPLLPENQDMISSNVILTRGNDGGQIYNIVTETAADNEESPSGTLWALGTTADVDNLEFNKFRTTIRPQQVVGQDLVLFLVADNVLLDIKFDSWSTNKGGGFSYTRSTE